MNIKFLCSVILSFSLLVFMNLAAVDSSLIARGGEREAGQEFRRPEDPRQQEMRDQELRNQELRHDVNGAYGDYGGGSGTVIYAPNPTPPPAAPLEPN